MEPQLYIEDIEKAFNGTITKRINQRQLAISVAALVASAALLFLTALVEDKASALNMLLLTVGGGGIVWGIASLFFARRQYLYTPTSSPIRLRSVYIDNNASVPLAAMVGTLYFGRLETVGKSHSSNVKLEVWLSRDGSFAAVQLLHYRPHEFYPVTPIVEIPAGEIPSVAAFAKR